VHGTEEEGSVAVVLAGESAEWFSGSCCCGRGRREKERELVDMG